MILICLGAVVATPAPGSADWICGWASATQLHRIAAISVKAAAEVFDIRVFLLTLELLG
jgi:hypothetical protein